MSAQAIEEAAKQLQDCRRILVFDNTQKVLFSNFKVNPAELQALAHVFASRTDAIRSGMVIDGKRYEVHQHHVDGSDPLVYGRTMAGEPDSSEGAAIHKLVEGSEASPVYSVITYPLPHVSARMVPLLMHFSHQALR